MRKRKQRRARSSADSSAAYSITDFARRSGVLALPGALVFHALFVYGLSPIVAKLCMLAVIPAVPLGFAMRWIRSTTTLLCISLAILLFTLVYTMGVIAPLGYLSLSGSTLGLPLAAVALCVGLGALLAWRIHVSFRDDWCGPVEAGPSVALDVKAGTLDRVNTGARSAFFTWIPLLMLGVVVPWLFLGRGTDAYLALALGVGPLLVAIVVTDGAARTVTFIWVFRRWEREHGVRLRLPPLQSGRRR